MDVYYVIIAVLLMMLTFLSLAYLIVTKGRKNQTSARRLGE